MSQALDDGRTKPGARRDADVGMAFSSNLPNKPPETPKSSLWPTVVAELLFKTGLVRAAESLGRRVSWRSDGNMALLPRRVTEPRFAILCYHRIGTQGVVPLHSALPREVFERQMAYLKRHYRVISLEKLLAETTEQGNKEPAPQDHMLNPITAVAFAHEIGAPVILLDSPCGHSSPACISAGPVAAQFLADPSSPSETLHEAPGSNPKTE